MGALIIGAMIILVLLTVIFLYCGMIVAAKDDEEVQKMLEDMNIKNKKGGKK